MRYLFDVFTYLARIARVSYTHTRRQVREHVDTVLGYLIAPVFHRPRHCLSFFPVPFAPSPFSTEARSYGRVQRRVNANFTRSITFSTWIIWCSWRACCRHAVSRSKNWYYRSYSRTRISTSNLEYLADASWNISSVYFSIAESNESRRRFDIVPTKDLANSKKVTSIATHRNFAITSNYIRANCEF